ncbi:DNA polymerase III subunit delta' [secondary endosymbiont of Trabutina mannipara]|uniref:DNA polymerase III subunit delta' n=1 Tax=secondary endosymbiont of Trabutina mannipara TaxID=1835721 RepID=A0A1C3L483_9ENTR|nr:DNA polymerase III subunit delta' C-terminal domain-containing protein [secondary endosymbiont of Trabutina mannipara]SBT82082.1 DNA polymerase III subunit delta' [secondary endosymbiont of Trabutina mannipara]
MKWYPWLNRPYRQILNCYQQNSGHHALLLHSQQGNGELSLCYAIIRWLMCQQHNGIKSCGICHSCQLMKSGNHPDFYQLEIETDSKILGVNSIRTIIDRVYERARQGGVKIVWLPQSDYLTVQAATALLKTIEEPPEDTYFLLGCQKRLRLLPTLRSRCLYWSLLAPEESIGILWLKQYGYYDLLSARTALRLCSGAVPAAEVLLQPKRWQERLNLCDALQNAYTNSDFLALLPSLNKDDNGPLYWLLSFLSDALKWQQGAQEFLVNSDRTLLVDSIAARWPAIVLHSQWQQWLYCLRQLQEINVTNSELLLTHYLLNWEHGIVENYIYSQ